MSVFYQPLEGSIDQPKAQAFSVALDLRGSQGDKQPLDYLGKQFRPHVFKTQNENGILFPNTMRNMYVLCAGQS